MGEVKGRAALENLESRADAGHVAEEFQGSCWKIVKSAGYSDLTFMSLLLSAAVSDS